MIFSTYIRTELVRKLIIISLILNEFHRVKGRYLIHVIASASSHYIKAIFMLAVFFHTSSSKA